MPRRRTLMLTAAQRQELAYHRDHGQCLYMRERCAAMVRIADGHTPSLREQCRSRRYRGPAYRGYIASKRRHFYGLRLHLVITPTGAPVELFLIPGADNDTGALQWYQFDLPAGATIIDDKAFTVYAIEDDLHALGIALCPLRKKNSKRAIPPWGTYLRERQRKYVATAGSVLLRQFPKPILVVTAAGSERKLVLFLLAYSLDRLVG